jgi:virginiamycin B lyase
MAYPKAALALAFALCAGTAHAQTLAGNVRSTEEAAMEGVLVNAHADGSNITVTVVTDAQGHYAFPADRLAPGHYTLAIRPVGYDLAGPSAADVSANAPATATHAAHSPTTARRGQRRSIPFPPRIIGLE